MSPQFRRLFHDYYAIHETIHAILSESNGGPLRVIDVEQRVRDVHPDIDMGPVTLAAAIRQAAKDTHAAISE